jgi:ferritin-like metal-binding protein YciE
MTTTANEHLNDWLRDAHAMEEQAEKMLNAQADRLEHYPALRARIVQHIELMAFGQAVGGMTASDEVVKGAMAGYVFENLEIASYTSLIGAAKAVGDSATQTACEQILVQEKAMAAWLLEHLPEITQAFLARSEAPGVTAKV